MGIAEWVICAERNPEGLVPAIPLMYIYSRQRVESMGEKHVPRYFPLLSVLMLLIAINAVVLIVALLFVRDVTSLLIASRVVGPQDVSRIVYVSLAVSLVVTFFTYIVSRTVFEKRRLNSRKS